MNILLAMINSFWLAALAAGLVWFALRLLPLNAATRYVIWWCALAVALALPVAPKISLERGSAGTAAAILQTSQISSTPLPEEPVIVRLEPHGLPWRQALLSLWAAAFLYRLLRITDSYLRLRGIKNRAVAASIALPPMRRRMTVALSGEISSPMAVGFLRPAVILPSTLAGQLTATEMANVVLHEAAHLARRDDWANLAARLLGAALALHPVAIWILRRIEREREIACDDWAVAHGGAAQNGGARAYAAALARVFELRWAQRDEALASGLLGASVRLSDRIALLLRRGRDFSPHASLARVSVCAAVLIAFFAAATRAPRWVALAQDSPHFAVASIKPDTSRPPVTMKINADGISFSGVTLVNCIKSAYHLYDYQIVGGEPYRSAEYDIIAKADSKASPDQLMLMLRALLAEHFKLTFHKETKDLPVLLLGIAKDGSKLKSSNGEEPADGIRPADGGLRFTRYSMPQLGEFLSRLGSLGRPVLDRTGLEGEYDFTLRIEGQKYDIDSREGADDFKRAMRDWPSIAEDLREQLGLKLDASKGPVERLIIDHAEKPVEN